MTSACKIRLQITKANGFGGPYERSLSKGQTHLKALKIADQKAAKIVQQRCFARDFVFQSMKK